MGAGGVQWVPDLQVLANTCAVSGGLVFVSAIREGVLHAIDEETGKPQWTHTDWSWISGVLVGADELYLGNSCGDLIVLAKDTGETVRVVVHPPSLETMREEKVPILVFQKEPQAVGFSNPSLFTTGNEGKVGMRTSYLVSLTDFKVTINPGATPGQQAARDVTLSREERDVQEVVRDYVKRRMPPVPLIEREKAVVEEVKELFFRAKKDDPEAIESLKQMLEGNQTDLHALMAAEMVGRWKPERKFMPHLIEGYKPNLIPEAVSSYCRAFAAIGDPTPIPVLIARLPETPGDNPSEKAKLGQYEPVAEALESLSGQSFGFDRERWNAWWQSSKEKILQGLEPLPSLSD